MTTDLKTQLRSYFEDFEASLPTITAEEAREAGYVGLAAHRVRFRWAIALAAAAVVLVLVGGAALLFRGDGGVTPVVTEPPPTSPDVTGPPPIEPPVVSAERWQLVGTSVIQSAVGLLDVERTGSGLVAVGFDPGVDLLQDGVVLVSEDGFNWSRLAENDPALTAGTTLIEQVVEGGPGLVAVGGSCENDACESGLYPTVWTSTDGTAWTRISPGPADNPRPGGFAALTVTSHGYIAAGAIDEPVGDASVSLPAIWLSPDAADWSRVWEGETSGDASAGISGLAEGPDGVVVAVGSAPNDAGDPAGAVWVSSDGRTWERIDPNAPVFATEASIRSNVLMLDVTWGPNGFVAVGTDGGDRPAIWNSPDGRAWTRIDLTEQPFDGATSLSAVSPLGSGLIAAGPDGFVDGYPSPVTLWTSSDGRSWDRVLTLGEGWTQSVVVLDTAIAVAGQTVEGDGTSRFDYKAAVWLGPAFDVDAPPPDPLPPATESETPHAHVSTLARGVACEELATAGYSYAEAAIYWSLHGTPADLDRDANGIPCEGAFSSEDVADVFGPSQGLAVTFDWHLGGNIPFQAAGPAVDAGVMCPSGTAEFITNPPPKRPEAFHRWQDHITCDDGSGTFIVGADVFVSTDYEYGIWNIVGGSGAYATLEGGGTSLTGPITATSSGWGGDRLTGRITTNGSR
jgi:hypothetical protein